MTTKLHRQDTTITEIGEIKDPFADLSSLRLSQSFEETCGVKKLITTVPVRKPNPQDFVRVHPDASYREKFPAIELKDDRELYLITGDVAPDLAGECIPATLYTAINRKVCCSFGLCAYPVPMVVGTNGTDPRQRRRSWRCAIGSG